MDISLFHVISERKQAGKKIVAVGTTVCRTLESLPYVWQSLDEGKKFGISGTPGTFVNGTFLNGAVPQSDLKAAIDAELATVSK